MDTGLTKKEIRPATSNMKENAMPCPVTSYPKDKMLSVAADFSGLGDFTLIDQMAIQGCMTLFVSCKVKVAHSPQEAHMPGA